MLDMARFGAKATYDNRCLSGDLFCKAYFKGFRKAMNKMAADPNRFFFAPMLTAIEDSSWGKTISAFYCSDDADCQSHVDHLSSKKRG